MRWNLSLDVYKSHGLLELVIRNRAFPFQDLFEMLFLDFDMHLLYIY